MLHCVHVPQFLGVDLASFLRVQGSKHLLQFSLVVVVFDFLLDDVAELVERNVPGTCTTTFHLLPKICHHDIQYLRRRLVG